MIQASTISFLDNLAQNNNKTWFDANRAAYEAAKQDFEGFVTQLLAGLSVAEPAFKEQKAKDCIFRIFRDVRFSKDKTPYKAHFGAYFSKGGKKFTGAGYYFHLQPGGNSFAGGGLWEPETPLLKAVRQEIDYNFAEFNKIIEDKKFKTIFGKINGEQLKTLPAGYKEDNPAIAYLKLKSFTTAHNITDNELTAKGLVKKTGDIFDAMLPFVDFLNRAVS